MSFLKRTRFVDTQSYNVPRSFPVLIVTPILQLVIRRFVIFGFDYPWITNIVHNLRYADLGLVKG